MADGQKDNQEIFVDVIQILGVVLPPLIALYTRLRSEGYSVPTIEDLDKRLAELRAMPDLPTE